MTKAELAAQIQEKVGVQKGEAVDLVETVLEVMKETLEQGEELMISRFGRFEVKIKRPRRGRNPHTGEALMLDGRRVVTFKLSPVLRDLLNK